MQRDPGAGCPDQLHPGTNFIKYHTYKWVPIEGGSHPNQIVDAQIKQAVDSQLAAKGLTKTDSDKADLYIGYQVAIDQEKQWNAYSTGGPGRVAWAAPQAPRSAMRLWSSIICMTREREQLVWTGNASKTLNPSGNQEKNQKNLDKAMQKLLKNFPPKQ